MGARMCTRLAQSFAIRQESWLYNTAAASIFHMTHTITKHHRLHNNVCLIVVDQVLLCCQHRIGHFWHLHACTLLAQLMHIACLCMCRRRTFHLESDACEFECVV